MSHGQLDGVLTDLSESGIGSLVANRDHIRGYRTSMESIDPDTLARNEALAFWLNLYNAGALDLAAEAVLISEESVLRVPGAFHEPWASVAGEQLSLDDIEHGKIRRFKDPRIHGALVCGSASCPTLRYEAYRGADLDTQLDDQMRSFLRGGGATYDESTDTLRLSRVFLWYGSDFVRPQRMPTWLPATKRSVARAVAQWLEPELQPRAAGSDVAFQSYDWGLSCAIG